MICSECKKNTAIIFINSIDKDGKESLKGLCYDCAKKKGIDPLDVIAKQNNILNNNINNNNNMSNQIESLFKDLSKNLNLESLNLVNLGNDPTDSDDDDSADKNINGMPLESLFAAIFAAEIFVVIPPVPYPEPAPFAIALILSSMRSTTGINVASGLFLGSSVYKPSISVNNNKRSALISCGVWFSFSNF